MYLPKIYKNSNIWLTIDIEELEDANFNIQPKQKLSINYTNLLKQWDSLCKKYQQYSTAFTLGTFAKKYPTLIKKLAQNGHEIACHGLTHELVYTLSFDKWYHQTQEAKKILEDIIGTQVVGYRAPSWSMPFKKEYYEALVDLGFSYSSSYFPFRTYMYGNKIDKKFPFTIVTTNGNITEIPIVKDFIPFSGGFYLRILPSFLIHHLFENLIKKGFKPIIYIHPYELIPNLFRRFLKEVEFNLSYILTFITLEDTITKLDTILQNLNKGTR